MRSDLSSKDTFFKTVLKKSTVKIERGSTAIFIGENVLAVDGILTIQYLCQFIKVIFLLRKEKGPRRSL